MKKTLLFLVVALFAFTTNVCAETVNIRQHTYRVLEYKYPIGSGSDWKGGLAGLSRDEYPAYATRVTERIFQMFSQRVPGRMESGDFDSVQRQVLRQLWEPRKVYVPEGAYFLGMSYARGVHMAPSGHVYRNRTGQNMVGPGVQVDIPGGWRLRVVLQNEPGVVTKENCGNVVLTEIWRKDRVAPKAVIVGRQQPVKVKKRIVFRPKVIIRTGNTYYHRQKLSPAPAPKRVRAKKSVHKVERHWQVNPRTGEKRLLYQKRAGRVQKWGSRSHQGRGPRHPRYYRR